MRIADLLERLWVEYAAITPQAERVHRLLVGRGETIVNDHVALRTFDLPEVGIEALDRAFVAAGYEPADSYEFRDKHLVACHYEHPDRSLPKVFLSALEVGALSDEAQAIVRRLVGELPAGLAAQGDFAAAGRPWQLSYRDYERLAEESEYAAWVAAFGFRANHFTVSVNALETFASLEELNAFLKAEGFRLNQSGGEIKGSPADHLEQSSTLADEVDVSFTDRAARVPSCYYEFARRYPLPDGTLFQGFVPRSADRLFESTDRHPGE